jgi:predicted neuraminidase
MAILLWEVVAEPTERFPACHCSVIWELDNGDLLVGYYAGEDEARPDAAWVLARRRPNATEFDPLTIVADTPGKPEGNGILFQAQDGTVRLIYGTMQGKLDGPHGLGVRWTSCDLRMRRSEDNGQTWSGVQMIEPEWGHVPRCKPIRLLNGEVIFGTEYKDGHSYFWLSADEGVTWRMTGPVPGPRTEQPALIQRADGTLLALLRPSGDIPALFKSYSADNGKTWTAAEQLHLACPHAALDAVRLADGRVVLAWNSAPDRRNPLTLALSEDEGETWPSIRHLVTGEGQFHYPAIIQSRDGLLHLTFTNNRRTIDHIVLSPEWIAGQGADLPPWSAQKKQRSLQP